MTGEFQLKDMEVVRRATMAYGLIFATQGAVSEVEDWLDDHCDGEWSLVVEDMDEDLVKKSLRISFELEADKTRFIDDYARA